MQKAAETQQAPPSPAPLIYAAISRVMGDIGAVSKDQKNPQQGYKFRGIDQMYNAVQPAMVKHGVFCAPEVTASTREERPAKSGGVLTYTTLTVRHRFYAADGSFVDVVTIGEAMDSGDKSTNKAMSAAMKYALIELFAIPTEEEKDTEADSPEPAARAPARPASKQAPKAPPPAPANGNGKTSPYPQQSSPGQDAMKAASDIQKAMAGATSRASLSYLKQDILSIRQPNLRANLIALSKKRWEELEGTDEPVRDGYDPHSDPEPPSREPGEEG